MTLKNHTIKGFKYKGDTVIGRRQFNAPFTYNDSLVNEARLVHVLKGHSTLICAGKIIALKPGDTLLMTADNFINQWREEANENAVDFIGLRLTQSLMQQLYQGQLPKALETAENKTETSPASALLLNKSDAVTSYFKTLQDYMEQPALLAESLVGLKVQELIQLIVTLHPDSEETAALSQIFISNQPVLQEVVQTHLCSPLKVEELAFLCHMSTSTFNRKFKQIYGTSAKKYLIDKRLNKAKAQVLLSSKNLTEIAFDCGFEELSYFSRVYKQRFGVSPSQSRKTVD